MVSNRVKIPEDHVDTFVNRLSESHGIEEQPGFRGMKILSPIDAEGHVTMTFWDSIDDYERWLESKSFEDAHSGSSAEETFERPNEVEVHEVIVERNPQTPSS